MTDDGKWHLDKRVPLALILVVVLQLGAWVWAFAALNERVTQLEEMIAATADRGGRLVRVETQIGHLQLGQERIENKLDRIIDQYR